ncbi:hypothetical protein MVES_000984 [Malassezia vespertilionis]|uniref:assimilatory sulfite reductase (NADPH) n=1 Tax=Malassezia vespertilionis TaxID=2020962 RepID=A0A2N1JEZ6_9BASI|nr:hypothetical protein MVES_000984 [Malassezia vespertilionis]
MGESSVAAVWHVVRNTASAVVAVGMNEAVSTADLSETQLFEQHTLAAEVGTVVENQVRAAPTHLVSVLLASDQSVLLRLVPYLPALAKSPVVFHIETGAQHADVLLLRQSGVCVLYSATAAQAQDNAFVAHKIATSSGTGVLHFYDKDASSLQRIDAGALRKAIPKEATAAALTEELVENAFKDATSLAGHAVQPYAVYGANTGATSCAIILGPGGNDLADAAHIPVISLSFIRPLFAQRLVELITPAADRIAVLERSAKRSTRLAPLFVDIASAFQHVPERSMPSVFISGVLGNVNIKSADAAAHTLARAFDTGETGFVVGDALSVPTESGNMAIERKEFRHERGYHTMLEQLFKERLHVVNAPSDASHPSAASPEYAFGRVLAELEQCDHLQDEARRIVANGSVSAELLRALEAWLAAKSDAQRADACTALRTALNSSDSRDVETLRAFDQHFDPKSRWIIGSDAWAYDAGMGGVHHVISSQRNVNMLIFDTVPYSGRENVPLHQRKKDIGLYAMNYGNTYVASTALYANYTQVLHAMMEADRFDGPSIVLAYVPYHIFDAPALDVLRETKLGVDSGYWPMYRWDPSAEERGKEVFHLDSVRIREQLRAFLDRQNHWSLLSNAQPQLPYDIVSSQGIALRAHQQRKAKEAYDSLLGSLEGPPLLILFASDGGGAEKVAKRLGTRGKLRGLGVRVMAMDDFPLDDLAVETNVVLVSSTAGQGEFPQNGRLFFKALSKLPTGMLTDETRFAIFGMGDSHYWPRPEDAGYYNKPAKDLDKRMADIGAQRLIELGLGDDQDADGWQTGYKPWESCLWKALGVDNVEVTEQEPEPITNEHIKIASNYLRGTIVEGLQDESTGAIADTDTQLTKFHGTYMQYDRDTIEERKNAGLEPAYGFMIRVRMPGGVCTPEQWLQLDRVAEDYGGIPSLKITTRQTVQYHMILKKNLKSAMQSINKSLFDTIAACGDVNRNVLCTSDPAITEVHEQMYEYSVKISEYLLPRMNAYHEIWLDRGTDSSKKMLVGGALQDYEPMYGAYYLPRKFKIAIALPPRNDVDLFANDIGLIAIADPQRKTLLGFNLAIGGGMGVTHSMKATYPRLASVIGFLRLDQVCEACREVMLIQRDTGNRQNRKQARLKYTIDKVWGGADNFRAELERRLGYKLEEPRPYHFDSNTDRYGWSQDYRGLWHCTLWLENGRVIDEPKSPFRTGLRELAKIHKGTFRLTANQHIIVSEVTEQEKPKVEALLREYRLDNWKHSGLRLSASACVAFPTCGLAMAESERYIFTLVDKVEKIYLECGLRHDEITFRMTGCPNGCARPWIAEIGFVGKAPGTYVMLLGGGYNGERLNKIYRDNVQEAEILEILGILIPRYAKERLNGEHFGDWVIRAGIIAETTHGAAFYDHVDTQKPLR